MVAITAVVATLSIISMTVLTKATASVREQKFMREDTSSRYIAEAALAEAMFELGKGASGAVGSPDQPRNWGDAEYYVEALDLGGGATELRSTGVDGSGGTRLELVVREISTTGVRYGAFGDEGMILDSNAMVDSYDSSSGDYASQATNGSGNSTHAGSDGHVGSNGNVHLRQNSSVYGDATPGPTSTVTVDGNAQVTGSTAPASQPMPMPPIDVPVIPTSGDLTVAGQSAHQLPAGEHRFERLNLEPGSTLTIVGPATVVVAAADLDQNSQLLIDGTAGDVEIYVENDFILGSNTLVSPISHNPSELSLYLEANNVADPLQDIDLDEVDLLSNAKLYGTIYAPNARIDVNSNFELFGAIAARALVLDSNSKVHFDESLASTSGPGGTDYEHVAWRELPFSVQ
ncbi:MAG: hypothetical protein GY711_33825 [bacterium]|nr:hypothetical protein [bacterium]